MSATSFGGSWDSVRTNDAHMKRLFMNHLKEAAIYSTFPFLKLLLLSQHDSKAEIDNITEGIVSKRRNAKDQTRRDLLQILLDTQAANPDSFSEKHLKEEMRLFM